MAAEDDGVLDLSTGPPRNRTSPAPSWARPPPVSPNLSSGNGSDSGLDTVDSARNSSDGGGAPLSPCILAISPATASDLSPETAPESDLPPMPRMLMLPTTTGGIGASASDVLTSSSDALFKMYPYDSMMMANPLTLSGLTGLSAGTLPPGLGAMDANPFSGSVTQLMSQRRQRKPIEKRVVDADEEESDGSHASKKKAGSPVPTDKKDDSYWERRRRNNDAAKRSRDMRRRKEEEIAMRAAFLEQENLKLRAQVAILKNETAKLHYMLYNRL